MCNVHVNVHVRDEIIIIIIGNIIIKTFTVRPCVFRSLLLETCHNKKTTPTENANFVQHW